jgi:hypothetical protein
MTPEFDAIDATKYQRHFTRRQFGICAPASAILHTTRSLASAAASWYGHATACLH